MAFKLLIDDKTCLTDSWELKHATRNISPTNNQANIVDLHPASVYSIRMYSYNVIGKSEASKELTISTEEARKSAVHLIFSSFGTRESNVLFCRRSLGSRSAEDVC